MAVLALVCATGLQWEGGRRAYAAASDDAGYKLIAHPHGTAGVLDRDRVADLFLKKKRDWPNGDAAFPVDLELGASARIAFSRDVLRRPVAAVRRYWQQIIFAGRGLPPPELSSDAAVVRYVLAHPGAIGYVSPGADVGAARVLVVK